MSTIVRRKRQSRRELGPYRRYELLCGEIVYPAQNYDGYGDGDSRDLTDFISDEMRADWAANREELIAFWKSGEYTHDLPWLFVRGSRNTLPWAAKALDKKRNSA